MEFLNSNAVIAAVGPTLALVQMVQSVEDLTCEVVALPQFHSDTIRELAINPAISVRASGFTRGSVGKCGVGMGWGALGGLPRPLAAHGLRPSGLAALRSRPSLARHPAAHCLLLSVGTCVSACVGTYVCVCAPQGLVLTGGFDGNVFVTDLQQVWGLVAEYAPLWCGAPMFLHGRAARRGCLPAAPEPAPHCSPGQTPRGTARVCTPHPAGLCEPVCNVCMVRGAGAGGLLRPVARGVCV